MKNDPADQLNVKMPHVERALACFSNTPTIPSVAGRTNSEMARDLGLTEQAVKNVLSIIYQTVTGGIVSTLRS